MSVNLREQYNTRNPAVKRLMREAKELYNATEDYYAQPLEDNLFEWHFTVRGPDDTEFQGGYYHGRILLPPEYPMKPPNIIILTPNGRFETNTKICLSISGHHPESWQPSWSIRTALLAIVGFMPTPALGTVGSLEYMPLERKTLAKQSKHWECERCGPISKLLKSRTGETITFQAEASEIASKMNLKVEKMEIGEIEERPSEVEANNSSETELPAPGTSGLRRRPARQDTGATQLEQLQEPYYGRTTSNVFICLILVAIAILVYRRIFLCSETVAM